MSGTSVDGIDIACVDLELDGDELGCGYRGVLSVPFDATLRDRIVAALPPGEPGAGELCQLGPAGALMDPAASWASGGTERFDADGALAGRGTVSEPLLARLKAEPYYRLPPPRSTGRELFNAGYLRTMLAGIDPAQAGPDVAATVTRLLVDLLAEAA
jgi:1,6-anhydro-N-acetylmuramate kinase